MAKFCPEIKLPYAVRGEETVKGAKLTNHIIGTPGKLIDWGIKRALWSVFFLATYEREVMEFAEYIVPNPIVIRQARQQESLDNIKQYYVKFRNQDEKLCDYRRTSDHFLSYDVRKTTGWLTGRMSQDGHWVAVLSGDLTVEQRLERTFCPGKTKKEIFEPTRALIAKVYGLLPYNSDERKLEVQIKERLALTNKSGKSAWPL
ncbi:DEAD-box helicase Dbp80-like [Topomyia yanbarensis]|uniref:DEAD-box helicase Dbp80-like n=1 Tax=Topomyia yanbarensis TaxID=2498891 RepID=UPI00273BE902|nr:DEAD-box helicase Dbp80-like [Topomyia yanbarensis]